jgi:arylsulfatase A-like enzyme/Flp pilus assembly protein TadD
MRKSLNRRICAVAVCAALLGGAAGIVLWPRERVNLVLITLDTTRADRLGCYGYQAALTPNLDKLAARGVVFENAYTPCPLTFPAHSTMFTGLTPREHGLHHNVVGELDPEIPTLTEMIRSRGYETGGFVGAFVLNRRFGLNRGFLRYDDFTGAEIDEEHVYRRRGGQLVVDAALEWLKARATRPFFCWVHLFDPHAPYKAHEELFGQRFEERPYDGGIAFADQQIGRIVEFLDQHKVMGRTLIVVAGDHGEGLGEHAEREHGHMLYNSTLRVPLLMTHSSLCKPGHRVTRAVSLVDLLPTFQECLGLKAIRGLSGRSLKAALRGDAVATGVCYAETDLPFIEHRWAPQRSLIAENWKYIRSPRSELYDLDEDPHELHNLAESHREKLDELESLLAAMEARQVFRSAPEARLSPADRRALASLGYIANNNNRGDGNDRARQNLPDVKDRIKYHYALEEANKLLSRDRAQEALPELAEVVKAAPESFLARMLLGEALGKLGRLDDALRLFRDLALSEPERGEVHARLGWILGQQGQFEEALAELRRARELAPESADYRVHLGATFLELGRPEDAQEMFQSAVQLDPVNGNFEIGKLLAAAGDTEGAIQHYQLTLEHDPNWIPLYTEVAVWLARQKRFEEAFAYAARAVQMSPQDADAHYNLGVMFAQMGKYDESVGPLKEALRLNPRHPKAAAQLMRAQDALKSVRGQTGNQESN